MSRCPTAMGTLRGGPSTPLLIQVKRSRLRSPRRLPPLIAILIARFLFVSLRRSKTVALVPPSCEFGKFLEILRESFDREDRGSQMMEVVDVPPVRSKVAKMRSHVALRRKHTSSSS